MMGRMATSLTRTIPLSQLFARWWHASWHVVRLGAKVLVLALSPSSWRQPHWPAMARHLVQASVPLAFWFAVVSALLSVVIIRIVLVTAQSYGLSQYALEMVVRVLVLELIPLIAAMFVALRVTLPAAAELAVLRERGALAAPGSVAGAGARPLPADVLQAQVLPRAVAGMFAVGLLAALACVLCLVLAYLLAFGVSPWGLGRYTRLVGSVFTPAVTLIFTLKTLAFALVVSLIPIGSALHDRPYAGAGASGPVSVELQGLVRMFLALLVVEIASLMGNYY